MNAAVALLFAANTLIASATYSAEDGTKPVHAPWDLDKVGCTVLCHYTQGQEFKGSVHYLKGYICTDCHGGVLDTFEEKKAHSKKAGFIGRPTHKEVPEVCGKCHQPQKAEFMTSVHAETISTGGAVCIDCHDNHKVLPPEDPDSTIYRANLAGTCGKCHPGPEKNFDLSAHAAASESATGTMKACYDCHGNHAIREASLSIFDETCQKCHEAGTSEAKTGQKIRTMLATFDERIDEASGNLEPMARFGLSIDEWQSKIRQASAASEMAEVAQHTVQPASVEAALKNADSTLSEVETAAKNFSARRQNHITVLVFVWVLILLALGLIKARRNELKKMTSSENEHLGGTSR